MTKLAIRSSDEIVKKLGQVIYVAGTQWGDEGKGKLVDILSQNYDIIARSAGGANAGHTICFKNGGESEKFVFHLLPSGILHEEKISVLGNGTVIHIPTLLEEINQLKEKGIHVMDRILISDRAHILFDYHKDIDALQEEKKGAKKVGTTKRGIGPAYTDKVARRGIRMGDLMNFDHFAEKFRANAEAKMKAYGIEVDIMEQINYYKDAVDLLEGMVINVTEYLNKAHQEGKSILAEGAQGTHLDIDHGTYPYVTSSSTTSGGVATGLGIAPNKLDSVVGIVKAYTTRVGSGPFPTELGDMEGNMLREQGGEFGATTGRPRRCGWVDCVVVRDAIMLNGITSINLTKLDVLTGFQSIKIGLSYTLDGQEVSSIPASLEDFERVEVDYLDMPGWTEDISKAKKFDDLPQNAQGYVLKLEELFGIPVNFIGVGVHRSELIYR